MVAKYHIITDLQCRVLHFGTEVCTATPDKDICINLSRGKHILSFISTENSADCYNTVLEVPENDYESFIEVHLQPVANQRIQKEEEAAELKKRKEREEEVHRIKAKREAAELKKIKEREEELRRIKAESDKREHLFYTKEFENLNDYFTSLYNDRELYEVIKPQLSSELKYGWSSVSKDAVRNKSVWAISPQYDLATPFFYGIAMVGKIVELKPGYFDWKYYYIDVKGNILYELGSAEQGIAYFFGVAIIVETDINKPQFIRIVSKDGKVLYKRLLSETLTLAERPEFPIHFSTSDQSKYSVNLTFRLKDWNLDRALNHHWQEPGRITALRFNYEERHSSPAYMKTYFDSLTSIHTLIGQKTSK